MSNSKDVYIYTVNLEITSIFSKIISNKLCVLDKSYVASGKCKVSDTLTALFTMELRQTTERVTPDDLET
jgi:hypothetical protein